MAESINGFKNRVKMQKVLLTLILGIAFITELAAQKNIAFDYPEDSVTEDSKKAFVKQFNKGKILYGINCAQCHNSKENRKEIIPDFSLPQLMDYEMILYPEHGDRLNDTRITDAEMARIILFLRFKKKSGVPARR